MQPVLYLDVDGVLNALGGQKHWRHGWKPGWDDFKRHKIDGYELYLSQKMGAAILQLVLEGNIEVKWCTTWAENAPRLIAPKLGFPTDWPVITPNKLVMSALSGYKWEAVRRDVIKHRRPTIWIDDEAIPMDAHQWFERQGVRCLLMEPSVIDGLGQEHIRAMKDWLSFFK